jgi:hypothetical protein
MLSLDLRQETNDHPAPVLLIERAQTFMARLDEAVAARQLTADEAQTMYRQWVDAQG